MSAQLTKSSTNIDRIIAKIDNDFNPDNSDWIPRVGAWVIDAMSQIDALKTIKKRRKLNVKERTKLLFLRNYLSTFILLLLQQLEL